VTSLGIGTFAGGFAALLGVAAEHAPAGVAADAAGVGELLAVGVLPSELQAATPATSGSESAATTDEERTNVMDMVRDPRGRAP
jgi:hypothetical protein